MYGKDFWKRTNVNQILEFIRSGGELLSNKTEKQTAEERHHHYSIDLIKSTFKARDDIIAFDWNSIANDEYLISEKTYEIFNDMSDISCKLNDLAFEVGFFTGLKIYHDIKNRLPTGTKD